MQLEFGYRSLDLLVYFEALPMCLPVLDRVILYPYIPTQST